MSTMVYLFIEWYESVEDYENKKRKQEDFKQEFTVEFMRHLGKIVLNNLR